jgi:hypothetical protein
MIAVRGYFFIFPKKRLEIIRDLKNEADLKLIDNFMQFVKKFNQPFLYKPIQFQN